MNQVLYIKEDFESVEDFKLFKDFYQDEIWFKLFENMIRPDFYKLFLWHIHLEENFTTRLSLYSTAAKAAWSLNPENGFNLLNLIDKNFYYAFPKEEREYWSEIRQSISWLSAAWMHVHKKTERLDVHPQFLENIDSLIPGACIIDDFKFNKKHRPDFMANVEGKIRPIEIKINRATQKSVNQILRYIEVYKADLGYLVAPDIRVELPDNIKFIQFDISKIGNC